MKYYLFRSKCKETVDMKLNEILSLVQPLSDKIQDTKDVNEGLQGQIRYDLCCATTAGVVDF